MVVTLSRGTSNDKLQRWALILALGAASKPSRKQVRRCSLGAKVVERGATSDDVCTKVAT